METICISPNYAVICMSAHAILIMHSSILCLIQAPNEWYVWPCKKNIEFGLQDIIWFVTTTSFSWNNYNAK